MSTLRAKFEPRPCFDAQSVLLPPLSIAERPWVPIISCCVNFGFDVFKAAIIELILHPEYNSTLILRADILEDVELATTDGAQPGWVCGRRIHRVLRPRRPARDEAITQECTFYTRREDGVCAVVLKPELSPANTWPYYHPRVIYLGFYYIPVEQGSAIMRIEAVLPPDEAPVTLDCRLYRTCLSLLETAHRYGYGKMENYQKKGMHDRIIPRDVYQDHYMVMREKYKHLVNHWQEETDPLKHVFEEIGIATYLMLLWKQMFSPSDVPPSSGSSGQKWPESPGGFLDLGCGAGLLTHVLVSEGYRGHGIDVRARKSWDHYPQSTQSCLHVHALDPTSQAGHHSDWFAEGVFLIGNHADELTPWLPVLATLCSNCSGYFSLPCCAWTLDARFERSKKPPLPKSPIALPVVDVEGLGMQGSNANSSWNSSYAAYRVWLAHLSLSCGWEVECDVLRIPSTRNWAIIGRRRVAKTSEVFSKFREGVQGHVAGVHDRGQFKIRRLNTIGLHD